MKKISIIVFISLLLCSAFMYAQLTNPKLAGEIEMTPAHPNIGSIITFKVRVLVKNEPTDNLVLKGSIDGNKIFLKTYQGTTPAGYDEYIEFQWYSPTAGSHIVSVDIDPDNVITEEDETDNHLQKTFSVKSGSYVVSGNSNTMTASKIKSNITLNSKPVNIYVKPEILYSVTTQGTTYTWTIYGLIKSEFHDLDVLTVDIKVASSTANCKKRITLNDLKAGVYKKAEINCELPMGSYIAAIIADPDNVLLEKNRSDNTRIRSLDLSFVQ